VREEGDVLGQVDMREEEMSLVGQVAILKLAGEELKKGGKRDGSNDFCGAG